MIFENSLKKSILFTYLSKSNTFDLDQYMNSL